MDLLTRLLLVVSLCGCVQSSPLARMFQRRRDAFELYANEFTRAYEPYMFAAIPLHAPVPVVRVVSRAPLAPSASPHSQARGRDPLAAPSTRQASWTRPGAGYGAAALSTTHYAEPTRHYAGSIHHYADTAHLAPTPGHQYSEPTRQYTESPRHYAAAQSYSNQEYDDAYPRDFERPVYYQKPRRHVAPSYEYAADYYAPQLPVQPSTLPQLSYLAAAPATTYDAYTSQEAAAAPTVLYARPNHAGGYTYRRAPTPPAAHAPPSAAASVPAPAKKALHKLKDEKDPPFIIKIHKYRIVKDDLI